MTFCVLDGTLNLTHSLHRFAGGLLIVAGQFGSSAAFGGAPTFGTGASSFGTGTATFGGGATFGSGAVFGSQSPFGSTMFGSPASPPSSTAFSGGAAFGSGDGYAHCDSTVAGLGLRPRLYTGFVCLTASLQLVYAACGTVEMPVSFCL